ncbi:glycolate oxidase [Mycolicibacterium madagascariense]|uniref:Glycolate oxidase n=1 Tax=Mycolicibacterium madagascariense TaxID=212765 RepID=A0A7I7XG72_9MYCO|nr:FAD-linked oxidase C-terminal domain-containing protein [Mycolicibacterium madagascariense]MCV7013848.1 FAD-binding protein [Mycolicibacterium madagascariense]BBZ28115.1 glycolate oxidase [Mycolicibacterium madagascariense]
MATPVQPSTETAAAAFVRDLDAALPAGRVVDDPEVARSLSRDQAAGAPVGRPAAVVRARSTEEVRRVVEICVRHRVPVVARGAGTGLSGGANAIDGCVVLSLAAMSQIVSIDPLERLAVVQPGVVNDDLRAAVAEYGLWYPPDPASSPWSTLGGNVATNAGGLCCVKYGVTREYVLELEVVTGTAEVVRVGRRTAKGAAGYDLVGLLVGSEGTLGIVTEITVRLRTLPSAPITVAGFFPSLVTAGTAVRAIGAAGITPSALELMDRFCLRAVDEWKQMGLTAAGEVLLLARVDDPEPTGSALAEAIVEHFRASGAAWAERSTDAQEADALFSARRLAYPALERLGPVITEDVCVPREHVPEMLARIEALAVEHGVQIANIAHAGDGNLHPLIIGPGGDDADLWLRIEAAFDGILDAALALGGTITGEHGVGLLKRRGLEHELSPAVMGLHRSIKAALDPHAILNPGKIFQ